MEDGRCIAVTQIVPDNEKRLHDPDLSASLDSAIEWAGQNPPEETDLDILERNRHTYSNKTSFRKEQHREKKPVIKTIEVDAEPMSLT